MHGDHRFRLSYWGFHGEDKIVFCSTDTVCLWTFTLAAGCRMLISYSTCPCTYVKAVMSVGDAEIILVTEYSGCDGNFCRYKVRYLDTRTGGDSPKLLFDLGKMLVCDNVQLFGTRGGKKWLAVWSDRRCLCELYLYDLDTTELTAKWKGSRSLGFYICPYLE